jgi:U6 snRNA-associated Sm-like protein LSm7
MSERGAFANRSRGSRGGRGGRGGGGGQRGGAQGGDKTAERPKKENILDLNRFLDKQMRVKFNGGREGKLYSYAMRIASDC